MFCKKCGAKIEDDSLFCQSCGVEIKQLKTGMNKEKKVEKGKKYAMIAGMCWIVMGILNVNIEQWGKLIENGLVFNLLVNIVPFACLIGFGVLIFRQKLNLSVLLILGIWLLRQLYFLFINFVFMNCIDRITFIIF